MVAYSFQLANSRVGPVVESQYVLSSTVNNWQPHPWEKKSIPKNWSDVILWKVCREKYEIHNKISLKYSLNVCISPKVSLLVSLAYLTSLLEH